MDWTEIKDLLLTIGMVVGPTSAFFLAVGKLRTELGAQTLAAWKTTLEEVKEERSALAAERLESKEQREAAEHARIAAEHARTQSRLDNELAERAMQHNKECQDELESVNKRLTSLETEHGSCPGQIAKLEMNVKLLRYQLGLSEPPPE